MTEEEVDPASVTELEHGPDCRCLLCTCRRWLHYTPLEDRWPNGAGVKITTYGGLTSGSGEPDRMFDAVCTEADFSRALALIPSEFLRAVGSAWREVPAATWWFTDDRGRRRQKTGRRSDAVIAKVRAAHRADWNRARAHDEEDSVPLHVTLFRLLDECAREMAVVLGERIEGHAARRKPEVFVAEPPEWKNAPANRR